MNQLLEQFILEARDFLERISGDLLQLEKDPVNNEVITELFRAVHTLKGNSGLFNFPAMTKVLHAAEDLMVAVRDGKLSFSAEIADRIFESMDFVSTLLDEIEQTGDLSSDYNEQSVKIAESVKSVIPNSSEPDLSAKEDPDRETESFHGEDIMEILSGIPEKILMECFGIAQTGTPVSLVTYSPEESSFYKGEDPFLYARRTPGFLWGTAVEKEPWTPLEEMDCYRCNVEFRILSSAPEEDIREHFKYVPEQIRIRTIETSELVVPSGDKSDGEVYSDFVSDAESYLEEGSYDKLKQSAEVLLELSSPELLQSSVLRWIIFLLETAPDKTGLIKELINTLHPQGISEADVPEQDLGEADTEENDSAPSPAVSEDKEKSSGADNAELLLKTQLEVLKYGTGAQWEKGKIESCGKVIESCLRYLGKDPSGMKEHLEISINEGSHKPLAQWLSEFLGISKSKKNPSEENKPAEKKETAAIRHRSEDSVTGKFLKVDQTKIDRLMDLVGEMVVSKNALPFLAERAETIFNAPELSRELKTQFNIISRIVEEMQDAVMQIRMVPVSIVFQRFPRLVRDISRKLGKKVVLNIEGDDTEAEKNIIESLADPLVHIIRNSLDHGIETPETRIEKGKPETGTILLKAYQKADRVIIKVQDDGKGINPETIKRKAYEKGLIDETKLERITSEDEAVNLVFLPGFSTAENVSDISGRGVGMDVVKNAVEKIGGEVSLKSRPGNGTEISISLPLSMAVTNVMILESHGRIFGIQMDQIVETVRIPENRITVIKHQKTSVLRDRLIPLYSLTELLSIDKQPVPNSENEYAVVVVRVRGEYAGLIVDDFREVVDIILKPLPGELSRLSFYSGTALLGDGSILMIINPKEFF